MITETESSFMVWELAANCSHEKWEGLIIIFIATYIDTTTSHYS